MFSFFILQYARYVLSCSINFYVDMMLLLVYIYRDADYINARPDS